ncbi:biosynthetic-type acetolactate synthase large subunit [Paenibacillus sedimenti]|uniref:Acetolactate synthase n=1 Tax=Paenibacillus sedimenti TaxID=2770274 RepID=A0A926KPY0_9BACL|nr:biosynthetic-type acetolactate synthase large subunit [Paenibacillus sedimenti]MBD0380781.1 biosynthetic-type acetolactate synthase large subunit [Paenibacillus sedimenti]
MEQIKYAQTFKHKDNWRNELHKPDLLTGSEILLRTLLLENVECVFGYPGGSVLYIYDAMHGNEHFRHLLTRHEQGAIHAADGYARATGKVGVCIATSGPGATNLVTGIATAQMDSVPLVVITGNVPSEQLGTDAFQETDIVGITMPIVKHSFQVRKVEELARTIREAFYLANTGRKGPVLIDIPKDISAKRTTYHYPQRIEVRGYKPYPDIQTNVIESLLQAIEKAQRPIVLAGGGIVHSDASEELIRFIDTSGIPITTTLMGLSGFPGSHSLWLGMPGMHGTVAANRALVETDLLISLGARFDDRVTMSLKGFAPNARIAHIDIDAAELSKNVKADFPITGNVKDVLMNMNSRFKASADSARRIEPWIQMLLGLKKSFPLSYKQDITGLKPQYVIDLIMESTQGDAIIATDVGQHQMWAAQFYRFKHPRSLLTSGGLGTMGFGFPAAIGAQIGHPDKLVISINGDGGMQMCAQELAVCAIHHIPVKVVVINNQTLGMIRQWQEMIYDSRFSHIDLSGSPDFVKLAEAYGVKGLRAVSPAEAQAVWKEALEHDGPVLIDFLVDKDELVLPMIQVGKTLSDMIVEVR